MQRIIFIALILCLTISCSGRQNLNNSQTDTREIINVGIYAEYGHIVMFDMDEDRTPDYFEYYNCHPLLYGNAKNLTIKQSDGSYRFGNHSCKKVGYADFRVKWE